MQARIRSLPETRLIGIAASMSRAEDSTPQLWRTFMPRRGEIGNRLTRSYISMRVYGAEAISPEKMFAPANVFEKWAAVEVSDHDAVPEGMRPYTLKGGLYAVFVHEGPASAFPETMRRIFETWLPRSGYALDAREHFEVLGEGWRADAADAREEIWIPVRQGSDASHGAART